MRPGNDRIAQALRLYSNCAGPFQTILHWPYEGSMMNQPAVLVEFFELIRYHSAQKQEEETSQNSSTQPTSEQSFRQRQRALNKN